MRDMHDLGVARELVDEELKKGEWQEIKLVSSQGTAFVSDSLRKEFKLCSN